MVDAVTEQLREIMSPESEPVEQVEAEPVAEEVEQVLVDGEVVEETQELDDGSDITTIAQLAEAIEVDPAYLYEMQIGMGDNEEAVPLGELKDRYQNMLRDNTLMQEKLNSQAELISKAEQGFSMGNQMSAEMTQAVGQLQNVQQQYQQTDWKALEQEDPGNAALLRQKFQEAHSNAQAQIQHVQAGQQQLQAQYMQHAGQKLGQMIPEWTNKEVRESEQAGIRQMMVAAGYSEQFLNNVSDPAAVSLARELYLLKKDKAAAQGAVERVRKAPKVLRGSRGATQGGQRTQDLINQAKADKTPNRGKSELAAVKSLLNL